MEGRGGKRSRAENCRLEAYLGQGAVAAHTREMWEWEHWSLGLGGGGESWDQELRGLPVQGPAS